MIQRQDHSDRRTLSFPAVNPCEGVSPATLLSSLITLSRQICDYHSKFFATQKRNAKQTIRQVRILSEFFEDVWETRSALSGSILLCFSELHLAFQKIKFLLEDCSKEGCRVWILMKSEFVAGQFRALIRSVATALDILPLETIDVASELKELVDLVGKQARKANFVLDQDDESAMREVRLILDYFEKGVEPDPGVIKRVLDYIEIRTWSDCNKEIKFLEKEIAFECTDCAEREISLLNSLMAFMSYCRGVIFERSDNEISDQQDIKQSSEILSCLNPEDFRCPISLELMTDPVTVSTGQTYDRSSIQKWLKAGNLICPKTGEKLSSPDLVPNLTLRKLIQQFCADNGISLAKLGRKNRDITRTILPGSLAAARALKYLSRFLARRLVFGSIEQKNKAAYEIRLLAKSNVFNRSCLVDAGTISPLLNLSYSLDATIQENVISALLKLSKHTNGRKVIVDCGGVRTIVSVLKRGLTLESKQTAAATIFYLSLVKGCQKLIGETPDAIPSLVDLIREGTSCGQKNAVVAIFGLLLHPGNHRRVLEAGTIPLLVNILSTSDKVELIADSLAVLASLAENVDGTLVILQAAALPLIVKLFRSSSSKAGKEYSVSILLSLCSNGGKDVVAALARDSSLIASLYSLLNDGASSASNASKKARSLLKTLLDFNERSYTSLVASAQSREHRRSHRYNVL